MKSGSDRRNFLKYGTGTATLALFLSSAANALEAVCGLTPPQTKGPFYPGETQFDQDTDLTQMPGNKRRAEGQIIYVTGRVTDQNCVPLANANVEIWQACASGRYNNAKDPNPAPIDPNFKYWAETFTDAQGQYRFKTILPGAYPAAEGWIRPPHIHFKVSKLGYKELITQMYFKGDVYNDRDLILLDIPEHERESVIVDFVPSPDLEIGSHMGRFDISLRSVK